MVEAGHLRDLIGLRAGQDGGRVFITEPDTGLGLTFARLGAEAWRLGRILGDLGLGAGDRVAVCGPNGLALSWALLSVAGAGMVAVPFPQVASPAELAGLLGDSGARAVLAERSVAGEVARRLAEAGTGFSGPIGEAFLEAGPDGPRRPGLALVGPVAPAAAGEGAPEGLAAILYTSGTTGRPKGVMLSHRNLLAECRNVSRAHGLVPGDKALCLLPLHHVNGLVVTLLGPLYAGHGVVMPDRFRAGRLWGWVRDHGVTWLSAVPTILSILLGRGLPPREGLGRLRFVRSASSALPAVVLERLEAALGVPVIESYGISEAGSQVTSNPLPPAARKPGSVGFPWGCEVAVFDGGRAVGPGQAGEVGIRGPNVFSGYWRDQLATMEAFSGPWFMTGDLGQLDGDGYLFLKGRRKELINRAGEMISPLEVDDALHRVEGVELAASVGVPHGLYGEEIVAFVTMAAGHETTGEDLALACRGFLSPFKIPKRFYFTGHLPKGPGGKIMRRRLVEAYLELAARGQGLEE
ncbi:MAG: AMP-binding protein [Deltaproteobacteria bacterium]|nr:AMP-binding protein [Deltaproteobacteria bacterium]